MRILHVTPSFHPAYVYGGTTKSVYDLCRNLAMAGCEVKVLTTDANGPNAVLDVDTKDEVQIEDRVVVRYCHRWMDVSVSPGLLGVLPSYIRWADVVHLMAVYSFPTIPTLLACKLMKKPVVWSPRGMLQRWEGSSRKGLKSIWNRVCRLASSRALRLHVTSEEEAVESRQMMPGLSTVVIPNIVEVPEKVSHTQRNGKLRVLYLGRLDPKKGIENLLGACKILNQAERVDLSLTIAGGGDQGYTRSITDSIHQLGLSDRVNAVGAVQGDAKRALFEQADVAVFPSYTENFGMVVAEALAHGVPVIASRGTPWSRVEEVNCGLWVDNSPQSLAEAIRRMSSMPMPEMGQRGRRWIREEFAGDRLAARMIELYSSLKCESP